MRPLLLRVSPDLLHVKLMEMFVSTSGLTSAEHSSIRLLPASRGASDAVETVTVGVGTVDVYKERNIISLCETLRRQIYLL